MKNTPDRGPLRFSALFLLACLWAGCATAPVRVAVPARLPILDMHMHARRADHYGPPPIPMCTPFERMPSWDPAEPFEKAFDAFLKTAPCKEPVQSAMTDDEVLRQTVAVMERRHMIGMLGGEPGLVERWMAAAPGRFIPGLDFQLEPGPNYAMGSDGKALSPEEVRALYRRGAFQVLGEVLTSPEGIAPDDPRLEPYWALAEELDIPVAIHIGPGGPGEFYLGNRGYRARLQSALTLEEVLVRHPRMRVYIMHAGYPMLDDLLALLFAHPQVYVDIGSIVYTEPRASFYRFLQGIMDAGYGDRVMFGSDPMVWPGVIEPSIECIEKAPFLNEKQKRDIFYNNAARFLRLNPEEITRHHNL
jgi:hypothetical protein